MNRELTNLLCEVSNHCTKEGINFYNLLEKMNNLTDSDIRYLVNFSTHVNNLEDIICAVNLIYKKNKYTYS